LPALALLTRLFRALENRQPLDSRDVEDVIIGCTTQTGEQGGNLARQLQLSTERNKV
jgi:acetyl-CoA C-acetyltransferase